MYKILTGIKKIPRPHDVEFILPQLFGIISIIKQFLICYIYKAFSLFSDGKNKRCILCTSIIKSINYIS
jgi:hypothetical protein